MIEGENEKKKERAGCENKEISFFFLLFCNLNRVLSRLFTFEGVFHGETQSSPKF